MPWVNGRFYANPAYGRGLERIRADEAGPTLEDKKAGGENSGGRWVTIDGRHVFIQDGSDKKKPSQAARLARGSVPKTRARTWC